MVDVKDGVLSGELRYVLIDSLFMILCHQWRAQEKINEERSLALSLEERQGTSSKEVAQTSKSPTDPQATSVGGNELDDIETEKPEEKLELPVSKSIVIEINDGPDVIVIE